MLNLGLCLILLLMNLRNPIVNYVDPTVTGGELDERFGGFRDYLRSHGDFDATAADLRKRFRFLGEFGTYYFLYVVGEEVPPHEEWARARGLKIPGN